MESLLPTFLQDCRFIVGHLTSKCDLNYYHQPTPPYTSPLFFEIIAIVNLTQLSPPELLWLKAKVEHVNIGDFPTITKIDLECEHCLRITSRKFLRQ